jgi:hypothetical protein
MVLLSINASERCAKHEVMSTSFSGFFHQNTSKRAQKGNSDTKNDSYLIKIYRNYKNMENTAIEDQDPH